MNHIRNVVLFCVCALVIVAVVDTRSIASAIAAAIAIRLIVGAFEGNVMVAMAFYSISTSIIAIIWVALSLSVPLQTLILVCAVATLIISIHDTDGCKSASHMTLDDML